ncbi:ABC transporter substrate-binding protein [Octadecabacter sp. G9-8]|uniref:ABC transporter substrate-binding protein n=1 Tax=Octadecabacter dasysiphoniae TaxID=2909341 RepID=A0ABS9CUF6_9RHOB|nr:ABC transporter substrate-binding protein [Octadecabacter dasysiphoniae]MCF2870412.1 ABC transporter substrate-binding protein [Octadecabacter dasysiphoniae]
MIKRRTLLGAAAASPLLSLPALGQSANSNVLKYVPSGNLTVLDPIFTPAAVSVTHGYCVFDTLYGVDAGQNPQPQMAAGHSVSDDGLEWRITLRDGLKFHDGEPVRAQDCAASLARWAQRDPFGQALNAATESFGYVDDKTIVIKLNRPFGPVLNAIGKPHSRPAMMMPERLATTDPQTQITEMVGSGPFRFVADEYVSGDRVVYEKFADYIPREGVAEWTSGGKQVNFDRLDWQIMPDAATAIAAIQAGEVDWIGTVLTDLQPILEMHPDVNLHRTDPYGVLHVIRFNHLIPPFDNVEIRRAVLKAVDQVPFLQSVAAKPEDREECLALFPCGTPGVEQVGEGIMGSLDIEAAKEAVMAAGYNGEPVVILNPTDIASIHPHGLLAADLLGKIGFNVDLVETDWGTVVQRRVSKETVENGGWNIAATNWPAISINNPATNATTRGLGESGWWGWYEDVEMERLVVDWLGAADEKAAAKLYLDVQNRAIDQVPTLPLGLSYSSGAVRADLQGALQGSVDMFWNIRRT